MSSCHLLIGERLKSAISQDTFAHYFATWARKVRSPVVTPYVPPPVDMPTTQVSLRHCTTSLRHLATHTLLVGTYQPRRHLTGIVMDRVAQGRRLERGHDRKGESCQAPSNTHVLVLNQLYPPSLPTSQKKTPAAAALGRIQDLLGVRVEDLEDHSGGACTNRFPYTRRRPLLTPRSPSPITRVTAYASKQVLGELVLQAFGAEMPTHACGSPILTHEQVRCLCPSRPRRLS